MPKGKEKGQHIPKVDP